MKALFTYDYGQEKMDRLRALGYEILYEHERGITYREEYSDVAVLCCYHPFKTLDIGKMKGLRFIQLSSIGFDQIPAEVDPAIVIANNRGGYSVPIGEWTVHTMLSIYKQARHFHEAQKAHRWKINGHLLELKGRRVGFIGTGTLAQESAKRLQGFDMEIVGFSQSGSPKPYLETTYTMDELEKRLPGLDFVILAVPHTPKTYHLMDSRMLDLMKDSSVLINISRGAVLDEKALIERHDKFLGIALDVFETEPLPEDHPLWDLDNLWISPHNSWVSDKRNQRRFELVYGNLKRFIEGEDPLNKVDLERGY